METAELALTLPQFIASRALGRAYHHLWAGVPDGTLKLADIEAYARPLYDPKFGGITFPTVIEGNGGLVVTHETLTGRLSWAVDRRGAVVLELFRPLSLQEARPKFSDIYREGESSRKVLVARVRIAASAGSLTPRSCLVSLSAESERQYRSQTERLPVWVEHDVRTDLLFERHVEALVLPLATLLTAEVGWPDNRFDPETQEETLGFSLFREIVLDPAIEKARQWLAPLLALNPYPDPYVDGYFPAELPVVYWYKGRENDDPMFVVQGDQKFPVESEKTAVHAVYLLRAHPEMLLVEAVQAAVISPYYRP